MRKCRCQFDNPVCGALIIPFDKKNGRILLAVRKDDPYKEKLCVIGGYLHGGEAPLEGAERELFEESRILHKLTFIDFFPVINEWEGDKFHSINFLYCALIDESFHFEAKSDAAGLVWANLNEIPKMPLDGSNKAIKSFKKWVSDLHG